MKATEIMAELGSGYLELRVQESRRPCYIFHSKLVKRLHRFFFLCYRGGSKRIGNVRGGKQTCMVTGGRVRMTL